MVADAKAMLEVLLRCVLFSCMVKVKVHIRVDLAWQDTRPGLNFAIRSRCVLSGVGFPGIILILVWLQAQPGSIPGPSWCLPSEADGLGAKGKWQNIVYETSEWNDGSKCSTA